MLPQIQSIKNYHPAYWLASLGAGGLAVTFFMYLMWLIPHKDTPIPIFEDWTSAISNGDFLSFLSVVSVIGIAVFSFIHLKLLFWNIFAYKQYGEIFKSNSKETANELQLFSIPLTFAMTINVMFIIGAIFVPKLWLIVEYLFPFALLGFAYIGYVALKNYGLYWINSFKNGINVEEYNSFASMLPGFAMLMVSVGMAAPAAMSHNEIVSVLGIMGSRLFLIVGGIAVISSLIIGVQSIFKNGFRIPASPSILMIVPALTLFGIEWIRLAHGFNHHLEANIVVADKFSFILNIVLIQSLFMIFGLKFMKNNNYLKDLNESNKTNPVSFGLICPFVAYFVMLMFFLHIGFVKTDIIELYSIVHYSLVSVFAILQGYTIYFYFKLLNKKEI